jgi:hypothetical protein
MGGLAAMTDVAQRVSVVDTIYGSSFLAIERVLRADYCRHLDPNKYAIQVVWDDGSTVVLFAEEDGTGRLRAIVGARPGSVNELSATELRALESKPELRVVDTVQGRSLAPIDAAVAVFRRRNPDLNQYKMSVVRERESVVVVFTDRHGETGARGNPGKLAGFEVELRSQDLAVLRSNFIR